MAAMVTMGAGKIVCLVDLGSRAVGHLRRRFCHRVGSTPSGERCSFGLRQTMGIDGDKSHCFETPLSLARRSTRNLLISSGDGTLVGRKSKAMSSITAARAVGAGEGAEASPVRFPLGYLSLLTDKNTSNRCIVLDIEGATTPISFVFDVLFPYARDNVARHLSATFEVPETRDDVKLLRIQVEDDLEKGVPGAVPIPPDEAQKEEVIAALVANVEAMIKADRKITPLKQLQGHIWRTGFSSDEIEAIVFEDVPQALQNWHTSGIKVYIYSSGSRLAQRLIFGNTNYGDLRNYLCGFFDTVVGNKKETRSYIEITEFLGVDKPSDILFVTDVYQEAIAAKGAGLEVVISIRPGNVPLPEGHGFKTVTSFLEI